MPTLCSDIAYYAQNYARPIGAAIPTVEFLIACSAVCENSGGIYYHVDDVSVYLGRQKGGRVPHCILRTRFSFLT